MGKIRHIKTMIKVLEENRVRENFLRDILEFDIEKGNTSNNIACHYLNITKEDDIIARYNDSNRAKSSSQCVDKVVFCFFSSSSFFFNTTPHTKTHKYTRTECERTMTRVFSSFSLCQPVSKLCGYSLSFVLHVCRFSLFFYASRLFVFAANVSNHIY
jgi:hypothetical protein